MVVGWWKSKYSGAVWPKRNQFQLGRLANLQFCPNPAAPLTDNSGSYWGKTGHPCHRQSRRLMTQSGALPP
jgi:hypothetical protein